MEQKKKIIVFSVVAAAVALLGLVVGITVWQVNKPKCSNPLQDDKETTKDKPPEPESSTEDPPRVRTLTGDFKDIPWGLDPTPKFSFDNEEHKDLLRENTSLAVHPHCQRIAPLVGFLRTVLMELERAEADDECVVRFPEEPSSPVMVFSLKDWMEPFVDFDAYDNYSRRLRMHIMERREVCLHKGVSEYVDGGTYGQAEMDALLTALRACNSSFLGAEGDPFSHIKKKMTVYAARAITSSPPQADGRKLALLASTLARVNAAIQPFQRPALMLQETDVLDAICDRRVPYTQAQLAMFMEASQQCSFVSNAGLSTLPAVTLLAQQHVRLSEQLGPLRIEMERASRENPHFDVLAQSGRDPHVWKQLLLARVLQSMIHQVISLDDLTVQFQMGAATLPATIDTVVDSFATRIRDLADFSDLVAANRDVLGTPAGDAIFADKSAGVQQHWQTYKANNAAANSMLLIEKHALYHALHEQCHAVSNRIYHEAMAGQDHIIH